MDARIEAVPNPGQIVRQICSLLADERSFLVAATMLEALGLRRIRLMTNNPDKMSALAACGIEVVGRVSHAFAANGINDQYLAAKATRFGHIVD